MTIPIADLEENTNYYITLNMPICIGNQFETYNLHVKILELKPKNSPVKKSVLFVTTNSSKDVLPASGYNPVTVPLSFISKAEI